MKSRLFGLLGRPEADACDAKKALRSSQKKQTQPSRYPSVSIVCGGKHCTAAKLLAGQRILARDAPSLPLAACNLSAQCKCSFQKHQDRREDGRRLPGEQSKWYGGAEKRRRGGRRRTD